ncbi:MAG: hypothetical protein JW864_07250 [Spirochaetes bacterium]|nr:hypothetical protein [Spirochaetota bacterium]
MKNLLSNIVKEWVTTNKKYFWKYEVSSFYATYKISILNMPNPSADDIKIKPDSPLFTAPEKKKLCNMIKNCSDKTEFKNNTSFNFQIDYIKDSVRASTI